MTEVKTSVANKRSEDGDARNHVGMKGVASDERGAGGRWQVPSVGVGGVGGVGDVGKGISHRFGSLRQGNFKEVGCE